MIRLLCAIQIICLLLITACERSEPVVSQPDAPAERNIASNTEWPTIGGSSLEQFYTPLAEINKNNIQKLGLAWFIELDTNRGQEATPILIGETLYTTTAWSKVIAVDAVSGKMKWQYDPEVAGETAYKGCCDVVNRGIAYFDGKLYSATLDGRLIALNAENGKLVWSTVTVDDNWPYTITGAPRIANGKVIIGNSGADLGARGYVTAYDAQSGELIWRFYTVPGDPSAEPDNAASDDVLSSIAAPTWFGEYWKYGGGGTVWDAIVVDQELNQLYIGVGNGSPWNHRIRSEGQGDNLFLSSIVALDPDTGKYLWHYQETPAETWDFTATQPIILADLSIHGENRKVLMQAPKNGFFYVLDRYTGKLISAENFVPVTWASHIDLKTGRPVETENARYQTPELALPGSPGAHNWQPMAYSPETGYVYIPAQSIPFLFKHDDQFIFRPGEWNLGVDLNAGPLPSTQKELEQLRSSLTGTLIAWDPVNQQLGWKVEHERPINGGVLATAGGLVFQGQSSGEFAAYDAINGEKYWDFNAQAGIVAAPMSYKIEGEQYIAVLTGYGGAMALALPNVYETKPRMPGRLLVFKLEGDAELPVLPEVPPPFITNEKIDTNAIERGRQLYSSYCSSCHAAGTLSANVVPDLRLSPYQASADSWNLVVIDGVLTDKGMVSFAGKLSKSEAEDIRIYVQNQSRELAARIKNIKKEDAK